MLTAGSASADTAPLLVSNSPWAAIAILAVVIGMMAGIIIWRRRR
jgi:LPXTG-motif cell wall-anchored protein